MRATIRDVAARAEVSINTVSRVLNNRPAVKQTTADRVRKAIDELGYRPNGLARALLRNSSNTIGLVVTDCTNPNTALQIRIIQQRMSAAGYAVLIFDSQESSDQEDMAIDVLEEKVVDGVILTPSEGSRLSSQSMSKGVPLVLLNRKLTQELACDVVLNDNAAGAHLATDHLIAQGHTRIAYVTSNRAISTVEERIRGYRCALANAGLPYQDDLVMRAGISIDEAAAVTNRLVQEGIRPTAIMAYNDLMAVGVISSLTANGIKVPAQVSLVGFDDIQYAPFLSVPLTTVRQPTTEMAGVAAELLLKRLTGDSEPPRRVVLAPELVVRASTAHALQSSGRFS